MRGDLLPFWEPSRPLDDTERQRWFAAAERIATGISILAHRDAYVDVVRAHVGFRCDHDVALASAYERAIRGERIDARRIAPIPGREADEIVLPCRPDATDEEIHHVVLAVMKASHALEFDIAWDAETSQPGRE